MPNSHDEDTAYFDIPFNAEHGMLLACSHPACSGTRKRFRYCAVCEVPVSKRNFIKRHSHDPMLLMNPKNRPTGPQASSDSEPEDSPMSTSAVVGCNDQEDDLVKNASTAASSEDSTDDDVDNKSSPCCLIMKEREKRWMSLLHTCPPVGDASAMDSWVSQVVNMARSKKEESPVAVSSTLGDAPAVASTSVDAPAAPPETIEQPSHAVLDTTQDFAEVSDSEGSDSTTPPDDYLLSLETLLEQDDDNFLLLDDSDDLGNADFDLELVGSLF